MSAPDRQMSNQSSRSPIITFPTLTRLSEVQARRMGERTAVTFAGADHSFADMHFRALRRARALHGQGIAKGDRVAYLGPNHPAIAEVLLASLRIGAIFVPLNWRLAVPELDYQLRDARVSRMIVAPELIDTAQRLTSDTPWEVMEWDLTTETGPGTASAQEDPIPAADVRAEDPAFLLYTSGTTGHPKGAVLSHANILWNTFNLLLDTDLSARDTTVVSAPLFHVAALDQQVMTSYIRGARCVFLPKWDVDAVFDAIEDLKVTWLFGVTTMFADLVQSPRWDDADLSSLRFVNSGGAPIPIALIRDYLDRNITFCQGYGLTETAPGATFLAAEDAIRKSGSAGRAVPFTDVAVFDAAGTPCGPGQHGEIVVRGPNVIDHYWENDSASRAAFTEGGWFHTGDIGYLDEEGFLFIVDRLKDMFISGGENVYPAEVESVLFDHPAVNEVAVVSAEDRRWGEVGRAFVVLADKACVTPDDLRRFAAERLAKYKVPRFFDIVDSLPRTGSGKVHKVSLRSSPALGAHSNEPGSATGPDSDRPHPPTKENQ